MNVRQGAMRRFVSRSRWAANDTICPSCRSKGSERSYAQAAVAEQPSSEPIPQFQSENGSPKQAYQIRAGVLLSRPPQITRDLHPFEKAFFLYQRRLNERLALPFTKYMYYKSKTPADEDEKTKRKSRRTAARDIGTYSGYGDEAWDDEVLVGAPESEQEHIMEALLKDAEPLDVAEGQEAFKAKPVDRPMPRITEADKLGDVKSLNRLLQRTLYLVVKGSTGEWTFPEASVLGPERLHRAAERILVQSGGPNMNTWIIGNVPVGFRGRVYTAGPSRKEDVEHLGEKTFFMKARIMAGQASLQNNEFGLKDFAWLAKEEVQPRVTAKYWADTQDMMVER